MAKTTIAIQVKYGIPRKDPIYMVVKNGSRIMAGSPL